MYTEGTTHVAAVLLFAELGVGLGGYYSSHFIIQYESAPGQETQFLPMLAGGSIGGGWHFS
jgi:hypothetical protein